MVSGGYMGKILFVNLSDNTWKEQELSESIYRQYMGGYGLGVRILFEHMKPGVDPLGEDSMLGFVSGTFVGSKSHAAGRFNVVFKSPLTGGWGDSSCGGNFGPKLKGTGYDAVFFSGQSDKPVYVYLTEESVEIKDASHLWGKDSSETERILWEELGKNVAVCSIGLAGENLSKISGIMHDQGRAAARMGLGAVMGSKNLKAFVAIGSKKTKIANEEAYNKVMEKLKIGITSEKTKMAERIGINGTGGVYVGNVAMQDSPTKNWKGLNQDLYSLERAEKIGGAAYTPYKKKRYGCAQCPILCGAILEVKDKDGELFETHRPEYETISSFGSLMLVDDIEMVIAANEKCNRYGLDTISTGATIAFAMECFEQGIITLKDTDGLDLKWGNTEAVLTMIDLMAFRKGIGAVFADGSKMAALKLGRGTEEYAMHTGGVEMAMHDPRCWPGFGYGYALDPTPGHHCQGTIGFMEHGWLDRDINEIIDITKLGENKYDYNGKGIPLKILNNWFHFFNGTGLCILAKYAYVKYPVLEMIRALTGWEDYNMEEALLAGERINTLRQIFNLQEGITWKDFTLPKRAQGIPAYESGPTAGVTIDMDKVRKDYYNAMDWDQETGVPSTDNLKKLGIDELVNKRVISD